ncbi:MAG: hypothetical protein R3F37_13965 [Candidatus Competibacteraceae bacterium]
MNAARCGAELIRRLLAFSRQQSLKPKVLSLTWQASEWVTIFSAVPWARRLPLKPILPRMCGTSAPT